MKRILDSSPESGVWQVDLMSSPSYLEDTVCPETHGSDFKNLIMPVCPTGS